MAEPDTFVSLAQVAAMLLATPQVLRAKLSILDDEMLRWRPNPGEWCIKEVIGHLTSSDQRAFAARIESMLIDSNPQLESWDVDQVVIQRGDRDRDILELLDEFAAPRAAYANLITELRPAQLTRTVYHPKYGQFQLSDFVYEWAYHDHGHLSQISNNAQAFIWSNMGQTMRSALSA